MIWFKMFLKWQWMDLFHCTYMLSYFCHRQDFYRTWQWAKEAVNPLRTPVFTPGAWWVGVYHSFLYCVLLCFVLVISFCILCSMLPHDSGLSILSCLLSFSFVYFSVVQNTYDIWRYTILYSAQQLIFRYEYRVKHDGEYLDP